MKMGVPKIPVIILSGISFGAKVRERTSTITIRIEPESIEIGMSFLLLLPKIKRTKFGTTRPIQPIVPPTETEKAVRAVAVAINNIKKKR